MNDLQKELQELKVKVAELESRISDEPVAKWQPKGGYFQIDCEGDVVCVNSFSHKKEFGTKRITREQAKRASIEMRKFNRLLALRDELCGDEDVYWGDDYKEKHHLYFSHERGWWYVLTDIFCESITPYFTTQELAQRACDMLNSGEVKL